MNKNKSLRRCNGQSFFHWCLFLSKILLFRSSTAFLIRSTTARSSSSSRRSFSFAQARSFRPALHGVHRLRAATGGNNGNNMPSFATTRTASSTSTTSTSTTTTTPNTRTAPAPTTTTADENKLPPTTIPPIARREEDRVVLAGIAPPDWKKDLPRQSESSQEALLDPPVPVPDPYGWLRDEKRENEEILQHLKMENAYTEGLTQHLQGLRETLYQEMLSAIQETDYTVPRPLQDWYYYTRTFQGKSYTVHCRAPKQKQQQPQSEEAEEGDTILAKMKSWDGTAEAPILEEEQVILDVNELAKNKPYCATGAVKRSPSHKLLAYSTDFTGGETCQLFVKDLETGEIVDHDDILEISGSISWSATDDALFYLKMDDAHRPFQLYKRNLNRTSGDEKDELLLEEKDELYWMGMSKSLDGKYLLVECSSKETSEYHFLDLNDPTATLQCIAKRRPKVLYDVEHRNGKWWIQSNVGGLPNMALWTAPAVANCQDEWTLVTDASTGKVLFEGGYDRSLDHVSCFKNHIVASGREGGLPRVWIARVGDDDAGNDIINATAAVAVQTFEMLDFAEEAYDAGLGTNLEFDTNKVVIAYDSLVTPTQSLEIALDDTSQRTVLKERAVPGYNRTEYACDRIMVQSRDGSTQIPVSLVYRKDVMERNLQKGESVHVHLYGYGSYGSTVEADFRSTRLPLLNRGIVYVIAHVRGGGEMGRQWYEEPNGAKYLCKKNTFNDFVDVARWLVEERKLTTPKLLSCEGRSAGGLLIGASINQAPELFKTAVHGVPFVDVVCTMIDASIPLTAIEWEEWGNPNEKKYFQYMMEYSPMQNVQKARYPSCLLTGGLHDPRVQYWEPAKFAAELRHSQAKGSGPVCVKMDMSAGHFSASDRYKYLKELAFDYAFLLDQMGLVAGE